MLLTYNFKVKLQIVLRRFILKITFYVTIDNIFQYITIEAAEPQNICSNIVAKYLQVQRTEILYLVPARKRQPACQQASSCVSLVLKISHVL